MTNCVQLAGTPPHAVILARSEAERLVKQVLEKMAIKAPAMLDACLGAGRAKGDESRPGAARGPLQGQRILLPQEIEEMAPEVVVQGGAHALGGGAPLARVLPQQRQDHLAQPGLLGLAELGDGVP